MKEMVPLGDVSASMKVLLRRTVVTPEGCWEWQGYRMPSGYGTVPVDGIQRLAHRVALTWFLGREIGPGLVANHLCMNRGCCNPQHLEETTYKGNSDYSLSFKTHCANGHPYVESNIYRAPGTGDRSCRVCRSHAEQRRPSRRKVGA